VIDYLWWDLSGSISLEISLSWWAIEVEGKVDFSNFRIDDDYDIKRYLIIFLQPDIFYLNASRRLLPYRFQQERDFQRNFQQPTTIP
jgi:hypothetical protein